MANTWLSSANALNSERVARRIEEEHRRLLADLAGEASVWSDHEIDARSRQAIGQRMPGVWRQEHAEVGNRDIVAVDRVRQPHRVRVRRVQMGNQLVAVEIEVDPVVRGSTLGATEQTAVEGSRCVEVVDGDGEVEARMTGHRRRVTQNGIA